ncbi:MAG: aminopeptidase [Spirochaetota bacterium]|nr:aminopeptidase [Spirochaetota bacterium]
MQKKYTYLFIYLIFIGLFTSCYLVKQGYHQLDLMNNKKPFSKVLSDPKISIKTKRKINIVRLVKYFATKELGLNNTDSYNYFININRKYVAYNLSAAYKDKLKPVTWQFPIIGRVPYLGFFELGDAIKEEAELKKKHFDTNLRGIPAYSTLGFFGDPLLSTMIKYPDSVLINIIIHEMTHETIYIRNNMRFNEALASFIANKGTILFLEKYYGKNSKLIQFTKNLDSDDLIFSNYINRLVLELDLFYKQSISREKKIKMRKLIFNKSQRYFKTNILPKLKTKVYNNFHKIKLNNAIILSLRRYNQNIMVFEKVYLLLNEDLRKTIKFFKRFNSLNANPLKYTYFWIKLQNKKKSLKDASQRSR